MRTALVAALEKTPGGTLRADLVFGGRSVLARQVDLLRAAGCERILCLCERTGETVLQVQREVEAAGGRFEALRGFIRLPALVRADDELVILADGVLPDPALMRSLFAAGPPGFVAAFGEANPLVARFPQDFERIDADRHWAGLLAMRGAPVQQLADFPPDSDAVSLLLRLALQAGTPCRMVAGAGADGGDWLLAADEAELARQEGALVVQAAGRIDWRQPSRAAARLAARRLASAAFGRGPAFGLAGAGILLVGGIAAGMIGAAGAGLALGSAGVLAAALAAALAGMRRRLSGMASRVGLAERAGPVVDLLAAACLFAALSPGPALAAIGALGPLAIGLARMLERASAPLPLAILGDRAVLLALLAMAAGLGWLPEAAALAALALLGGLLMREGPHLG